MRLFACLLLMLPTTTTLASNASMRFGPHAVHQCDNPVATITNDDSDARILERDVNGVCSSPLEYCVGDCVAVQVSGGGEVSDLINVIAGGNLPNPGTCSDVSKQNNFPEKTWDFSHTGKCGAGDSGEYNYHNCLVHDVCTWARCTDDAAVPGGPALPWYVENLLPLLIPGLNTILNLPGIPSKGGDDDQFCGDSYLGAEHGWKREHGNTGCLSDNSCPGSHPDCIIFECRNEKLDETGLCAVDADCKGYCQLNTNLGVPTCYNGSDGDPCGSNGNCQSGLTCYGVRPGAYCRPPKGEGGLCGEDADCIGYCEKLSCYDGSNGDPCGRDSDCQDGLSCVGLNGFQTCRYLRNEGSVCGADADCKGYCQNLRCWDGSRGDDCGRSSDCQPPYSCKRKHRFTWVRICK